MTTRPCWWLVAVDHGETTLVFGSDISMEQARQHGLEILPGVDFNVKKLPTRNLARASSLLKGSILEETHSFKDATKKLRHQTPSERMSKSSKTQRNSSQYQNQHDPW